MGKSAISPTRKLEFANYRKMRATSAEVFNYFNCKFQVKPLELPRSEKTVDLCNLKRTLKDNVENIELKTERAKREFIIAPIISEILHQSEAKLKASYWFEVSFQLKGYLSYFFSKNENLLIIESGELEKRRRKTGGFVLAESGTSKSLTQLGVEMIALDFAEETEKNLIYGLLTNGNTWQFSILNRKEKFIQSDMKTFDVFADIDELTQIISGILERK